VLVNLVQNSLDAMDEKSFQNDEKPTLHVSAREEDGRILLRVRDNGAGMTIETQEHVFDPFFTTKDVGKGMGLGLAISHRIIMDHQGSISLRSKPGEGTEFILDLPQACSYVHPHPEAAASI
jgi:C4-dicarboxylate-specific signal transduction histidine kinase